MRGILAAGTALLIIGSANAQTKPEECSALADSLQRLTCFDKLFPKSEGTNETQESKVEIEATNSPWDVTEEKSPIDDSPRIRAFILPKGGENKSSIFGSIGLGLRCHDNTTSVIYLHGDFSMNDTTQITYRFGDGSSQTEKWSSSDTRKAIGLWNGSRAIPFMKQLKNGMTLAIQTQTPRSEAVFELGNVEDIVQKVSAACKWK
ncbi:type VI secretion system-associated protein TagO [Pseudochrobactrum saccharolyticum]|uniref:type VI secretion system-associated protein TagO n=1 Tax=Pseudochrobactrum saccharolyticum TaxID=354352 RepID=UPI00274EFF3D|nr:type VI secretion system-associated protein TagO [Pseudochrobactrum saccharolyticum]MDP8250689.1 hypothetical protein [Pseudochrobactrum saccharolyticum]